MTIRCFLFNAAVCVITTHLLYAVNINAKDVESFQTKGSTRAIKSVNTSDFDSTSLLVCAQKCLSNRQCCVASFSKGTSTCRLDTSEKCCIDTETKDGWRTIRRNNYRSQLCSLCSISQRHYLGMLPVNKYVHIVYIEICGNLSFEENCKCLGGKLLELETSAENEFIKNEVRSLNTGVDGYWIGGYNFNNDLDMEWISKPNQVMPFSDMESGQPNYPVEQPCMLIWKGFDFRWGDHYCNTQLSYICEFQHQ